MTNPFTEFTMLIPTRNRPRMLANALRSYCDAPPFTIVVGDSSDEEAHAQNAAAIAACDRPITHLRYAPDTPVCEKWSQLAGYVQTPYGMYMADDDIALLEGVAESLDFLKAAPEFVACHGIYYNASLVAEDTLQMGTEYATISIDLESPVDRIFALVARYQAVSYAVQRRETLVAAVIPQDLDIHFGELFNAFRIVMTGKVSAIDSPFLIRNAQAGYQPGFLGDGNNFILHDSEGMSAGYVRFRNHLEPLLAPFTHKRSAAHIVDLAYTTFVAKTYNRTMVTNRLEGDGDIEPGTSRILGIIEGRPNTAPRPPTFVTPIVQQFMLSGWPRFG